MAVGRQTENKFFSQYLPVCHVELPLWIVTTAIPISVTYKWYQNTGRSTNWEFTGDTNDTYNMHFLNRTSLAQQAGVKVKVSSAGENASDIMRVFIAPDCNPYSLTTDSVSTNSPQM